MGAVCCCFGVSANNDHGNLTNSYASIFGGGRRHAAPPNNHAAPSSNSMVEHGSSTVPSISLSNIANPIYSRLAHEVPIRKQDKGSGHSRVEPEPVTDANVQVAHKLLAAEATSIDASSGKVLKECDSESSTKFFSTELDFVHGHLLPDSEDENVCPTCLEEYTLENPKIVAKCSHHYHLSCIYEWKERSESCPVCGKLMAFDEML